MSIKEEEEVEENSEPFRRLDHLGIPRARRDNSPIEMVNGGMRPPSSPLPSPEPDYPFVDE